MLNMPLPLRALLIVGSLLFFLVLLYLLKRKKLNVQYSIIWLTFGAVMLLFALVPAVVAFIGNIFKFEMPANLVFTILFVFVLLLLLSLSIISTGFADRIKRLTQSQALLEARVRQLEKQLSAKEAADSNESGGQ